MSAPGRPQREHRSAQHEGTTVSAAVYTVDCPVPADHPAFAGHFPGQPLWPGVLVLAEVMEALRRLRPEAVGAGGTLGAAKFLAPVRPGEALQIELADDTRGLRFEVRAGERVVARGQWQLGSSLAHGSATP